MDAITHLPTGTLLQGGKYKVVRFLSGNGHEYTYEAEHTLLSNRVVVKEFYVEYFCSRDEATARVTISANRRDEFVESLKKDFIKKAKIVFQMRHQHIARVLDIFEENGTAYYVMEYIDGLSLQEMVDQRGRLSEREAVKYVTQVADALKYVHSLNRLHLGLKPSKIIVNPSGNAVLIGFVAMTKYDDEEENSGLSTKDSGLSTTGYPHYAPIERMGAHSANFTPATDIYSLGATLYTLLTGITPPNAFSLVGEEETLQPLPQNISQGVRDAVYAAMRLRMRERPQTISEFIHILDWGESDEQDEETVINSEETIINNGEAIINNEGTVINGEETITKDAPSSSANDGGFVYTSAWLKEHTKIRGWLAFFLFTVMTSGVCSGVLTIATFDTSDYQGFLCLGFAYLTMGLLLFGTAMCALYAFFKRKPNAVFLVVTYLILVFATSLLSLIIVSSSKNSNVLSNTMSFIQSFVYSIIWLTYVSSSNRVKEVIPPSFRKATRRDWLILLGAILVPIIFMSIGMLQVRSVNNKKDYAIMSTASPKMSRLEEEVEAANMQCPIDMGIMGTLTSYELDHNNMICNLTVNEDAFNIDALKNTDPAVIKRNLIIKFKNSKSMKELMALLVEEKAGLVYKYIGNKSGKTFSYSFDYKALSSLYNDDEPNPNEALRAEVELSKLQCPMRVDEATVMTGLSIKGNYVVYVYEIDESEVPMANLKALRKEIKKNIIDSFDMSNPLMASFVSMCKNAQKGVKYRYIGDRTGQECTITVECSELK